MMNPLHSINDLADVVPDNSINKRKLFLRCIAFPVEVPDRIHVSPRKPMASVLFSKSCSSFDQFISHVICVGSKPQMIRIYARRIVAGMKYVDAFWNRAFVQYPRSTMGADSWTLSAHNQSSVPKSFKTSPYPTVFGFGHIIPKAFWECFRKSLRSKIPRSNFDHWFSQARFGLLAQPRLFVSCQNK